MDSLNDEQPDTSFKKKKKSGAFQSLGLTAPVLKGILKKGYKVPTPIQRKALPVILSGQDVVAMARTGSGKTAAFLLPLFEKLKQHSPIVGIRAIILSPTRELAIQTLRFAKEIGKFLDLTYSLLLGGDSFADQFTDLANNPDVVIATPGRLAHLLLEVDLSLKTVEYLVLDEADRLFELGFSEQLNLILKKLEGGHPQKVLMSATLPRDLVEFSRASLSNPTLIRLDTDSKISDELDLTFFLIHQEEKLAFLLYLLKNLIPSHNLTILFTSTKHHAEMLEMFLVEQGISATHIYGTMDSTQRKINLGKFRAQKVSVMVVTDVAARGLDIPLLDNVINYDFPSKPKLFVHRVGRAARAGRSGVAYSLVSPDDVAHLVDLQLFLGRELKNHIDEGVMVEKGGPLIYGSVPRASLYNEEVAVRDFLSSSVDADNLFRLSNNAYKQYLATRPLPSAESVRRAKVISTTAITHPILKLRIEPEEQTRIDLVESLKKFRPSYTILELLASNGKSEERNAVMRDKRLFHEHLIHQKKENDSSANVLSEYAPSNHHEVDDQKEEESAHEDRPPKKQRVTKSSRPLSLESHSLAKADNPYFIQYFKKDNASEKGLEVHESARFGTSDTLEILPDEDLNPRLKNKMTMKWDRKKKKFLNVNPQAEQKSKNLIRNESGALVSLNNYKPKLYEEWKKDTKRSIPREGELDKSGPRDNTAGHVLAKAMQRRKSSSKEKESLSIEPSIKKQSHKSKHGKSQKRELLTKDEIMKERKNKQKNISRNQPKPKSKTKTKTKTKSKPKSKGRR